MLSLAGPALAGETVVWNGPGDPATTAGQPATYTTPGGSVVSVSPTAASPSGNTVSVTADVLSADVASGYVHGGQQWAAGSGNSASSSNSVDVAAAAGSSITIDGSVIGGHADSSASGASATATANDNAAKVTRGSIGASVVPGYVVPGSVVGGFAYGVAAATAGGNTVTFTDSMASDAVYGGFATVANGIATASDNTVEIANSEVGDDVVGGYAAGSGATANGNTVKIADSTVHDDVAGGKAGSSGNAAANGNAVTITNSTLYGKVHGGEVNGPVTGSATGNTVTLGDAPVAVSGAIYGGLVVDWSATPTPIPGADAFSGNTLNVLGGGHSAGGVENFETMNFTLPANVANGDTLLDAGGGAVVLGDGVTGSGKATTVNLYVAGPLTRFAEGDTVNLIATTGSVSGDLANTSARAQAGLLVYDFTVGTTANTLFATLDLATGTPTPSGVADSAKALAEVNLGSVSLVNQGQDAVFTGIDILGGDGAGPLDAVAIDQRRRKTFVVIDADDSRYKTGSHVDVKGVKALAGLNAEIGNVSFGAFVEGGHGNYDSRNDFSGRRVKADGESDYAGAGVLARWDGGGGLWLEGSLRAGRTKTDFDSRDVLPGSRTRYHSRSDYVSGHGGIGYAFAPNPSDTLKLYSKILWTRLSNDAVTVHGDRVKFYSVDSLRWRNGFRWQRTAGEFRPYAGLAWEHEFDGKAKATVAGRKIDRPDLDGDTGIAEAGFRYTKAGSPFTIDLNLRGYAGQRQGWGGGVKMEYRF